MLFDENVDRSLKRFFGDEHEILTVAERGWKGKKNGDRGIPYQQNLSRFDTIVVVLRERSNAYEDLAPLVEKVSDALATVRPGHALFIEP